MNSLSVINVWNYSGKKCCECDCGNKATNVLIFSDSDEPLIVCVACGQDVVELARECEATAVVFSPKD